MDHRIALRILRFDWLEKQARTHSAAGRQRGNIHRMLRAARLEVAAYNKGMMGEVTPYRDCNEP
jgi:hypothetical protein